MLHPGMCASSIFNTQHVATRRSWVAKRATCCAQQCFDMLCRNVVTVWSEFFSGQSVGRNWNASVTDQGLSRSWCKRRFVLNSCPLGFQGCERSSTWDEEIRCERMRTRLTLNLRCSCDLTAGNSCTFSNVKTYSVTMIVRKKLFSCGPKGAGV